MVSAKARRGFAFFGRVFLMTLSFTMVLLSSGVVIALDIRFDPFPDHDNNFGWSGRSYASPEEACAESNFSYFRTDGSEPLCQRSFGGAIQSDEYGDKVFRCNIKTIEPDGCTGESRPAGVTRYGSCPEGEKYVSGIGCTCAYPGSDGTCGEGPQNAGEQCSEGNPVNYLNGNKFQRITDISAKGESQLLFVRTYNGRFNKDKSATPGAMGLHWSHNYEMRIINNATAADFAMAFRADGKVLVFEKPDSDWVGPPKYSLVSLIDGSWRLKHGGTIETYDASGRLINIKNLQNHYEITLIYTNPLIDTTSYTLLKQVSDNLGNQLTFTYSGRRLTGVSSSWDEAVGYTYSSSQLSQVSYADNTTEIYEYHGTTGRIKSITDRKGFRYAEWGYDSAGRATYSQHFDTDGSAVDRFDFDYTHINSSTNPRVSVTNPLGKTTTYHYQVVAGVKKTVLVEGHQSANCAAANRAYTWYSNGLLATKTDWKGVVTRYEYNDRGLEILKVEAEGTPDQRQTVTEWHNTFNLPVRVTEGSKITEYVYDTNGNVLTKTVKEQQSGQ